MGVQAVALLVGGVMEQEDNGARLDNGCGPVPVTAITYGGSLQGRSEQGARGVALTRLYGRGCAVWVRSCQPGAPLSHGWVDDHLKKGKGLQNGACVCGLQGRRLPDVACVREGSGRCGAEWRGAFPAQA